MVRQLQLWYDYCNFPLEVRTPLHVVERVLERVLELLLERVPGIVRSCPGSQRSRAPLRPTRVRSASEGPSLRRYSHGAGGRRALGRRANSLALGSPFLG